MGRPHAVARPRAIGQGRYTDLISRAPCRQKYLASLPTIYFGSAMGWVMGRSGAKVQIHAGCTDAGGSKWKISTVWWRLKEELALPSSLSSMFPSSLSSMFLSVFWILCSPDASTSPTPPRTSVSPFLLPCSGQTSASRKSSWWSPYIKWLNRRFSIDLHYPIHII